MSVKMLVVIFKKLHMPSGAFVEVLSSFSMSILENTIA